MITLATVAMVGAALLAWRGTGRASAAVAVVLCCMVVAWGLGLIP